MLILSESFLGMCPSLSTPVTSKCAASVMEERFDGWEIASS
jgi:hypothetical protein